MVGIHHQRSSAISFAGEGRSLVGHFHSSNRSRAGMDPVSGRELIHADEGDIHRFIRASAFARDGSEILYEQQGIDLFACGHR